ncbi:hypothetical protein FACS1894193_09750 [Bacilli bacterium]|nr:hypothetical protein FACS1894192_10000 [Bacilli bacterium]GHU43222.1 hypothetical protein FACS1894193_09750 [Bacilli bacterium]
MRRSGERINRLKVFYQELLNKLGRMAYKTNYQLEMANDNNSFETKFSKMIRDTIKVNWLEMTRRIKVILALEMLDVHLLAVIIEELYTILKNII